jgi:hypothetical protein
MENIRDAAEQANNDITSLIKKLKHKAYPMVSRYFIRAALVEGRLKNTDETFRCMFVENNNLMAYMLPRMYRENPVVLKRWRIWTPLLKRVVDTWSRSIDMCVAVVPLGRHPEFMGSAKFRGQMLIRSFINTSGGPEEVKRQLRDNKRRFYNKMEKNPTFSCRISRDLKDFDLFYYEMHVPHIQKRFEGLADLDSYERMKEFFLAGFLLLIQEGNTTVAGVLCTIENDTLFFRRTGILNGDEEYIKRGASSAKYYFTLKYALDHGIPKVDLMRSRPFFNDGVYNTKRKWGARVYPDDESRSWVLFFIPECSRKVASLFETNPLVIFNGDRMYGLVGWKGEDQPSAKDVEEFTQRYCSPGLDGLMLLRPDREDPVLIPFAGQEYEAKPLGSATTWAACSS